MISNIEGLGTKLGKIADASGKYAQESKAASLAGLIRVDLEVLLNYNRKTGHLLNYDSTTGRMGNCSMEVLRNRGIIQRLMDNKLIFPGGKLTPKGLQECERLQQLMPTRTASVPESDLSIEKSADRTETNSRAGSDRAQTADIRATAGAAGRSKARFCWETTAERGACFKTAAESGDDSRAASQG